MSMTKTIQLSGGDLGGEILDVASELQVGSVLTCMIGQRRLHYRLQSEELAVFIGEE